MQELIDISLRSLALAAVAGLCVRRVKSAAVQHAIWSIVTAGMLLQIPASVLLPPLPIPVLRTVEVSVARESAIDIARTPIVPAPHRTIPVFPALYIAGVVLCSGRMILALFRIRDLLSRAERIGIGLYQSSEITVPMTAGTRILLPADWSSWDAGKLRSVLAHEEAHVSRRDWAIALLARVNHCVFWFHPLAWWLERRLARLAELAADDAALTAVQDRRQYASALLEIAGAVGTGNGRFLTAGMAKETNVETRINRILDGSRSIPKTPGKLEWTAMAAIAGPLLYLAASVQLAPAQTVLSVPAPAPPEAPVMITQAAPPPPSVQAPEAPAPAPAPPPAPPPPAPSRSRDLRPGDGISVPKLYNSEGKSVFFSDPDNFPSAFKLNVSIEVGRQGLATISIPLPEGDSPYDVIAELRDQGDQRILNNSVTQASGTKWNTQVRLANGTYMLRVLVRNTTNRAVSTYQSSFVVQ